MVPPGPPGGVALTGAGSVAGGEQVGDGAGGEAVYGLVEQVGGAFAARPGLRRGTHPGGVLQDLVVVSRTAVNIADAHNPRSPACAMTLRSTPSSAPWP